MTDFFDNIPTLITGRNKPQWTVWEVVGETPEGKKLKIIRKPDGSPVPAGYEITKNTAEFKDVVAVCRTAPGRYYPGLWFLKEDGLIVMDSDDAQPPDFPTYTERSISRNSFHMIGWYDKKKDLPVIKGVGETYTGPHWIVLTGDCLPGKNLINDMNDFLVPYIESVKVKTGEPFKLQTTEKYKPGARWDTLRSYVRSEKSRGHPLDVIMEGARALNRNHFDPPHSDDYVIENVKKFWDMNDTKEFKEAMAKKKQEEEELKKIDISGITNKLNEPKSVNKLIHEYERGVKLGPTIHHNDEDDIEDKKKFSVPEHLLKVPGILQEVVNYYNATSIKDQPQFAVTTALAIGAMVTQRRYKTDQENYPSINIINVGDTSTGKERLKGVVEEIAIEAGLSNLIGPSGYTSAGGLFTALMKKPAQLSIIDELGRQISSAKKERSSNSETAQTAIMEIFGRLNGVHRPPGYSNMSALTKPQIQKQQKSEQSKTMKLDNGKTINVLPLGEDELYIRHPALSVFAMSTPETLYESLSSMLIRDGFLPRFIVVETELGRKPSKKPKPALVSQELIKWMQNCASNKAIMTDTDGSEMCVESDPKQCPEPTLIPFDPQCEKMLEKYEADLIEKMNTTKYLSEMYGKTREIAMRISLIVAISCESNRIMPGHLQWAMDFVNYYTEKLIDRLGYALSDSDLELVCNDIMRIIEKAGTYGATDREIYLKSRHARKYTFEARSKKIMPSLQNDRGIQFCYIERDGERKSKRFAWVTEEIAVSIDPTLVQN
ncbi:MAG: DUF3987 domain-containing protein [Tissierellia bacterium]|nr:DUF3987 domain-containing protein [Tissierellia bacterium]